ncbi:GNAT family N-acetyltransferase [Desulfuribacillus stibiiarsenatis]|uniref:GNAT family N-acetyltransferase n=1 Tax=Desulfuribacillus stibiiarsenatis TaxID=1390249 RepID=A0A1E5LAD2_9FIRM|nr:GNAT family N-acetyltransferase [Desulfuribacillus stibiiarsenatis]OEH87009.1 GNAT family N-acetyltransferase [Desulfuribacillus stibiiarsenatis]
MTDTYKIRKAEQTDIPCLVNLLGILFSIEHDFTVDRYKQQQGLERMLADPERCCIMVCERNHHVIGMCTAQFVISTAEGGLSSIIEDLVVEQEYRGSGVGKKLLNAVEDWSLKNGAKRIQLVADKNNTPALDFYKKNGWNATQLICLHKNY